MGAGRGDGARPDRLPPDARHAAHRGHGDVGAGVLRGGARRRRAGARRSRRPRCCSRWRAGAACSSRPSACTPGVPFGAYAYTGDLGAEVLGVPVVVPLAWTMMAWPALVVGRTLARRPCRSRWSAASALAAWDLFLDPQMVDAGHWTWAHPDPGLPLVPGVPLTNYAGWLVVSVVMVGVLDRLLPRHSGPSGPGRGPVPVDLRLVGAGARGVLRAAGVGARRRAGDGGAGAALRPCGVDVRGARLSPRSAPSPRRRRSPPGRPTPRRGPRRRRAGPGPQSAAPTRAPSSSRRSAPPRSASSTAPRRASRCGSSSAGGAVYRRRGGSRRAASSDSIAVVPAPGPRVPVAPGSVASGAAGRRHRLRHHRRSSSTFITVAPRVVRVVCGAVCSGVALRVGLVRVLVRRVGVRRSVRPQPRAAPSSSAPRPGRPARRRGRSRVR